MTMPIRSYEKLPALHTPDPLDAVAQSPWPFVGPDVRYFGSNNIHLSFNAASCLAIDSVWSQSTPLAEVESQASLYTNVLIDDLRFWAEDSSKLSQREFWEFSRSILYGRPPEIEAYCTKGKFLSSFDIFCTISIPSYSIIGGEIEAGWLKKLFTGDGRQSSNNFSDRPYVLDLTARDIRSIFKTLIDDLDGLENVVSLRDLAGVVRTTLCREVLKRATWRFPRVTGNSRGRRHPSTTRDRILGLSIHTGVSPPDSGARLRPVAGVGSWACLVWANAQEFNHVKVRRRNHTANLSDEICIRRAAARVSGSARSPAATCSGNVVPRRRCARSRLPVALSPRALRSCHRRQMARNLRVGRNVWRFGAKAGAATAAKIDGDLS